MSDLFCLETLEFCILFEIDSFLKNMFIGFIVCFILAIYAGIDDPIRVWVLFGEIELIAIHLVIRVIFGGFNQNRGIYLRSLVSFFIRKTEIPNISFWSRISSLIFGMQKLQNLKWCVLVVVGMLDIRSRSHNRIYCSMTTDNNLIVD